jgi:hypothetical protein
MEHTYNFGTRKAEVGGYQVQGQLGLQSETPSQKTNEQTRQKQQQKEIPKPNICMVTTTTTKSPAWAPLPYSTSPLLKFTWTE